MKRWLGDFPTHNASVALALSLIALTGLIVCTRLALGLDFPDGYDLWMMLLGGLAGVNAVGLGIKRATDASYKAAGTSPVTVEAPSNVTVETEAAGTTDSPPKFTRVTAQQVADATARLPTSAHEPSRTDDESGP